MRSTPSAQPSLVGPCDGTVGSNCFSPKRRLTGTLDQRCFTSRHVPIVAEKLVADLADGTLAPSTARQLQGLLSHLKQVSCPQDERVRQVMAMDCERLVPDEYDQPLRAEFERRCSYGDRMNTEMMASTKWTKFLQDCGVIFGLQGFLRPQGMAPPPGMISVQIADMAFQKSLLSCDYGNKRLNYELFCKALMMVAAYVYPDADDLQAAFNDFIASIMAALPPPEEGTLDKSMDDTLDPNVVVVVDRYKPALHDLFETVCSRLLENPLQARGGLGTMRMRERTYTKYSGTMTRSGSHIGHSLSGRRIAPRISISSASSCRTSDSTCEPDSSKGGILHNGSEHSDAEEPQLGVRHNLGISSAVAGVCVGGVGALSTATTTATGSTSFLTGSADASRAKPFEDLHEQEWEPVLPDQEHHDRHEEDSAVFLHNSSSGSAAAAAAASAHHGRSTGHAGADVSRSSTAPLDRRRSPNCTGLSCLTGLSFVAEDNDDMRVTRTNGYPVPADRARRMSVDQMLLMCKELGVVPELLSRPEVVNIFKRVQHTGFEQGYGSSMNGLLAWEEFVDAVQQLAIRAFSKEPFASQYPEAQEKVEHFLLRILPPDARGMRELFHYGRLGRAAGEY